MPVRLDGCLAAVLYEGCRLLITALQGRREDLVIFDPDGNIVLQVPSFISGQTEYPALDVSRTMFAVYWMETCGM